MRFERPQPEKMRRSFVDEESVDTSWIRDIVSSNFEPLRDWRSEDLSSLLAQSSCTLNSPHLIW